MSTSADTWLHFAKSVREALGGYEPTPIIAEFLKFLISNIYSDIVLVDLEGRVAFMAEMTEKYFGLPSGGAKGEMFSRFFPDNGLAEVAKTGIPQIARVQEVRGAKKIVTRVPLYKDDRLVGAVGRVVFEELEDIKMLYLRIEDLEAKVAGYKQAFIGSNTARYDFSDILGISQTMHETKDRAMRIAKTDSTVLVTGESGTGKELFAHSIHQFSHRAKGPFIRVNCAGIPFDLAESELFGYEKGAFTGASRMGQKGKFELAAGGTIFLDEISTMPLAIQAKLLRIIQEKEIFPLGSSETKRIDFRLIAASNVDLPLLVEKGSFRADLYYRLSAVPIHVKPLREHPEDIPVLARWLLPRVNQRLSGTVQSISPQVLKVLLNYRWPGNVRELINVLEQSTLNAYPSDEIHIEHLPSFVLEATHGHVEDDNAMRGAMRDTERRTISHALERNKGNKRKAAQDLGISRATLYQKLHRLKMI
jgi:transcriptional regulator with PAS, ATPase and Fis domain